MRRWRPAWNIHLSFAIVAGLVVLALVRYGPSSQETTEVSVPPDSAAVGVSDSTQVVVPPTQAELAEVPSTTEAADTESTTSVVATADGSDSTTTTLVQPATTSVTGGADSTTSVVTSTPEVTEPTTVATTTTQPAQEGVAGLIEYRARLQEIRGRVADLVEASNLANQTWDAREETGVDYQTTKAALVAVVDGSNELLGDVQGQAVPSGYEEQGELLVQNAARLLGLAEEVLAGLRLPAPEDGSVRRAALVEFNAAADALIGAAEDPEP